MQVHQHRPVSVGENESNEASNWQGWRRGLERKRLEDRKRKNLEMHEDGEGSSCRKDEMVCRLSKKPVLKHPKNFFFFFGKTCLEITHDLQTVIKYKVHTQARGRARCLSRLGPRQDNSARPLTCWTVLPRPRPEPALPASRAGIEPSLCELSPVRQPAPLRRL